MGQGNENIYHGEIEMTFVLGFIFGLFFLTCLFWSGGDVFQQLAKTRIDLESAEKKIEYLNMVISDLEFHSQQRKWK